MEAFVYCWTNHSTEQLYIGYHKGSPEDGYVCSSKSMLEDYIKDRSVFSRQIIATGTKEDCIALEKAILMSVDAKHNDAFYNKHNGNGNVAVPPGPHIGQFAGEKNPMYGKKHTPATIIKMSENRKGKGRQPKSPETREKMRQAALKRWEKQRGN